MTGVAAVTSGSSPCRVLAPVDGVTIASFVGDAVPEVTPELTVQSGLFLDRRSSTEVFVRVDPDE